MSDYRTAPRRTNDSKIAQHRLAAGLTQAQLAERIGAVPQTVQKWETGARKPKIEALLKMADVLGVEWSDLT